MTKLPREGENEDVLAKMAAKIAALEQRLILSGEIVAKERDQADKSVAVAESKEKLLKSTMLTLSLSLPSSTIDIESLRADVVRMEAERQSLLVRIATATAAEQETERRQSEVNVLRRDLQQLSSERQNLGEQNELKVKELIDLKLAICDLSDQVDRAKKAVRMQQKTPSAASQQRQPAQKERDRRKNGNSSSRGNSVSDEGEDGKSEVQSSLSDGSASKVSIPYSSLSSNHGKDLRFLPSTGSPNGFTGFAGVGMPHSPHFGSSAAINGKRINVRFERSPTLGIDAQDY